MALKAIEKYFSRYTAPEVYPWVSEMLRDIQAEVDSGYMKLPVDADGVPIRIGDMLECNANGYDGKFEVFAIGAGVVIGNHDIEFVTRHPTDWFHVARYCRHVKPRTIEDVLIDMLEAAVGYSDAHTDVSLVAVEKCADEIRELMEVDG
jgi:hypothetical protein